MQNYISQGQVINNGGSKVPPVQPMAVQPAPIQQAPVQSLQPLPQVQQVPVSAPVGTNPNYAGVNIQIFNPMVNTPNGYIYPQQTASAYSSGTQGGCYPAGYYTGQYASNPQQFPGGGNGAFPQSPQQYVNANGQNAGNTNNKDLNSAADRQNNTNAQNTSGNSTVQNSEGKTTTQSETSQSSNTPSAAPAVASANQSETSGKKTETKKVVELSDDYIKTLENYLNSQDLEVRKMGAHEVVNRLTEDPSRSDDPALTALVNKMLQDPSVAIRAIALSLIESRTVLGDDYTVNVLKKMQNSKDGFGQDAIQATNALLKMAGKTVEKEVPVSDKKENK